MRLGFAIAHYYAADGIGFHGSRGSNAGARIAALSGCIAALHALFGGPQVEIDWGKRRLNQANGERHAVEILVCTTLGRHVLANLSLDRSLYTHVRSNAIRSSSPSKRASHWPAGWAPMIISASSRMI